ncbi:MAG TPA: ricin-type beta-trefoil lectin domain protein [Candidatus Saccharimonadales bacterium]
MNLRQPRSRSRQAYAQPPKTKSLRRLKIVAALVIIGIAISVSLILNGTSHANTNGSPLKSGWSGFCLDDYRDKTNVAGNQVDIWSCNNSPAQDWDLSMTHIKHQDNDCLNVVNVSKIDISACSDDPSQVWLRDGSGYINPNTGLCLTAPASGQGQLLQLGSCTQLSSPAQNWQPTINYQTYSCPSDQAQAVACNAVKEWVSWQANPNSHLSLLNRYTGNASYEEWCADFVSYIFKESGHPFTSGNYNGWDENDANQLRSMGFTYHSASGYTPKIGDVGYFNYNDGHVEIVIVGGKHPTFVYGNSATIDPTTGNGDMATNTVLSLPKLGQIQYYLSPTSST